VPIFECIDNIDVNRPAEFPKVIERLQSVMDVVNELEHDDLGQNLRLIPALQSVMDVVNGLEQTDVAGS
jgi:hypothetical protein